MVKVEIIYRLREICYFVTMMSQPIKGDFEFSLRGYHFLINQADTKQLGLMLGETFKQGS